MYGHLNNLSCSRGYGISCILGPYGLDSNGIGVDGLFGLFGGIRWRRSGIRVIREEV